jgi:hypothetical protein
MTLAGFICFAAPGFLLNVKGTAKSNFEDSPFF